MKSWYRIEAAAADPSTVEIHIIDFIGDWIDQAMNEMFGEKITVTAKAFIDDLAKLSADVKALRVHINSPGGDVQGAINIANALRDQRTSKGRTVETVVDGIAASAASLIMMAGDPVRVADNAIVMIHNPWTIAVGNSAEMRKTADVLDQIRAAQLVPTYQWHSTLSVEEIVALMDAETWMDADEAVAGGFATEKVEGLKAAASIDPRAIAKLSIPEKFRARVDAFVAKPAPAPAPPTPAAAAEVLRLCREAGCLDVAEELVRAAATPDEVNARVAVESQARATAVARERDIRAACGTARLPELADGLVAGGMTLDQVRAHLTVVTAKVDGAVIDGNLPPDQGSRRKPVIDVVAVYAERNKARPAQMKE